MYDWCGRREDAACSSSVKWNLQFFFHCNVDHIVAPFPFAQSEAKNTEELFFKTPFNCLDKQIPARAASSPELDSSAVSPNQQNNIV